MRYYTEKVLITLGLFLLVFLGLVVKCSVADNWVYVKAVIDGDTVITEDDEHIRMIGVDAPEVKSRYNPRDNYLGPEAEAYVRRKIAGKRVRLVSDHESHDKYGRRLAYIYTEEGVCISLDLIQKGLGEAIHFFKYERKKEFLFAEAVAKKEKVGIWGKVTK